MAVSKVTSAQLWALALACLLVVDLDVAQVQASRELTGKSGSCAVKGVDIIAALSIPCGLTVKVGGIIGANVLKHKKGDACCNACQNVLAKIKAQDSKKCQCDILDLTIVLALDIQLDDLLKVCVGPAQANLCVNA
jgi:hypothetical protein